MRLTLLAGIAALAFTGVAQADTVISLTLNGTVTAGIDSEGLFGAQYADLTGDAVTLFLSYDVDSLNSLFAPKQTSSHNRDCAVGLWKVLCFCRGDPLPALTVKLSCSVNVCTGRDSSPQPA